MSIVGRDSSLSDRASRGAAPGLGRRRPRPNRRKPPKTPGRWLRRFLRLAKLLGVLGFVGSLGYGGYAAWLHLTSSQEFAIDRLTLEGNRRASSETLLRFAGVARGDNLLTVDLEAVERGLKAHPWVASAKVLRQLPRTLTISVVEHEPVVLVALEHLYYANAAGRLVKRLAPGENERLPVVTGLAREAVESGAPETMRQLREAIAFVQQVAALGPDGPTLSEVHVDPALGLAFVAEGSSTRVVLGHGSLQERLERAREVQRALAARGLMASKIIASPGRRKDRVVARLLPEEGAKPLTPVQAAAKLAASLELSARPPEPGAKAKERHGGRVSGATRTSGEGVRSSRP